MFTGIIEHTGIFRGYRLGKREMSVEAGFLVPRLEIGESLSIDGVCLSLIKKEKHLLYFNLSQETLKMTTLGTLKPNQLLNLELPLVLSSFLSGHLITGHVDGIGKVLKIQERRPGKRISVAIPPQLRKYFIPKGSVALNGVSLTVAELQEHAFDVELIPVTLKNTNLGTLKRGDPVNIECDIIGKYVYNWIGKKGL